MDLVDARAEAGRADHGAVSARQAAFCDILPMRVFQAGQESISKVATWHSTLDRGPDGVDGFLLGVEQIWASLRGW